MNAQLLVHQAALLNREGIAALACGHGEKAHASFKNVLQVLGYVTQTPDIAQIQLSSGTPLLAGYIPVAVPNMHCDRFYLYNNAFLFQLAQQSYSQVDVTLLSAAAIFNMALTYHQRALIGRQSEGMYRVAARMYDQCLQIISSLPAEQEDLKVLQMIVLNNRSHVAYELDDFHRAQAALAHVGRLSRRIARQTAEKLLVLAKVLTEDAFDEIALNVMVTSPPKTAPCA